MSLRNFINKVFGRERVPGVKVGDVLAGLPHEYMVFNDMLYDRGRIEHIIFSRKQGLFHVSVIPEKGDVIYSGTHLLVNRKKRPDIIKKSLRDSFYLKAALKERTGADVYVTPLVAFENARVKISAPIIGVKVLESSELQAAIQGAQARTELQDGIVIVLRGLCGVNISEG